MREQFHSRYRPLLAEFWDDFLLLFAKPAEPNLPLARFIYELKGKISWVEEDGMRNPVAKWKAFEPPKNLKLSVFRTDGLERYNIWQVDPGRVTKGARTTAVAVAHFNASDALEQDLEALVDNRPPRHVTIRGWPSVGERARYELIAAATKLASVAEIAIR